MERRARDLILKSISRSVSISRFCEHNNILTQKSRTTKKKMKMEMSVKKLGALVGTPLPQGEKQRELTPALERKWKQHG